MTFSISCMVEELREMLINEPPAHPPHECELSPTDRGRGSYQWALQFVYGRSSWGRAPRHSGCLRRLGSRQGYDASAGFHTRSTLVDNSRGRDPFHVTSWSNRLQV